MRPWSRLLVRFLDSGGSTAPLGEKGLLSKTYAEIAMLMSCSNWL